MQVGNLRYGPAVAGQICATRRGEVGFGGFGGAEELGEGDGDGLVAVADDEAGGAEGDVADEARGGFVTESGDEAAGFRERGVGGGGEGEGEEFHFRFKS
jgi:hypothetical protein